MKAKKAAAEAAKDGGGDGGGAPPPDKPMTALEKVKAKKAAKVRKTPSWPRSWANFSLL